MCPPAMKTKNATITIGGAVCGLILAGYGARAQNLFVGSYGSSRIVEFSGETSSTFATGMDYPTGLAFDNSGDLFESDQFSGNIYEWPGESLTRTTFATGLDQPGPMAFNSAGDLFVVLNGEVDEFDTSGKVIKMITNFSLAGGLAFDSKGNLYVSDLADGKITKITPGGAQSTFASGLNHPFGMAFNAADDLFVTGTSPYDTITEITPDGSQSLFASGLNQPWALAFDLSGNLFVADAGLGHEDGDVTEFVANGTKRVFDTTVSKPVSLAFQKAWPDSGRFSTFHLR